MLNIMILDDNNIMLEAFSNLVAWEENGFHVLACFKNGKEALRFLDTTSENVDIIFTDMKMPLMDGVTFLRELQNYPQYVKTVALSSYDDYSLVRESFTLGVQDYILKTEFDPEAVLALCSRFKDDLISHKYQECCLTDHKLIRRVLTKVDQDLKQNITLKSLSEEFEISSGYLGQLFSKYTNQSFNDYLNAKRIERAKEMLAQNNFKIYEIATECGYNNVEHFGRSFKKIVHQSPKEWQQGVHHPAVREGGSL